MPVREPNRKRAGGVLIVVENLPVPFDRRVWQEAKTLRDAGWSVRVICPKGRGFTRWHETIEGIEIWRHPLPEAKSFPLYFLEYGLALFFEFILTIYIFLFKGFNVIHICNPPDLLFLVALPFKPLGVKLIYDHHDLVPELYEAMGGRSKLIRRLLLFLEKLTMRVADLVISTNESYREIAIQRGKVPPERVVVVRSGPGRDFGPTPGFRVPEDRVGIGYIGVMAPQDGLLELVEAARVLVEDLGHREAIFYLIGDGSARPKVAERVKELGLGNHVLLLGSLPDQEARAVLSACRVCVNPDPPNRFNSLSTMNKVIEYMALGKPVVMFLGKEGRRSAQDAGVYVRDIREMAKAIASLLEDPERARRMGERGRRRFLAELSWERSAPNLLEAYARVMASPALRAFPPKWPKPKIPFSWPTGRLPWT